MMIALHSVGEWEILSHQIFFREINYLATSLALVKPLLSRNFWQKSVRDNFSFFHTVTNEHTISRKKHLQLAQSNHFHGKICQINYNTQQCVSCTILLYLVSLYAEFSNGKYRKTLRFILHFLYLKMAYFIHLSMPDTSISSNFVI